MNNNIDESKRQEIVNELIRFRGTTQYHQCSCVLPNIYLTDGTKYLVESCDCSWLMNRIACLQRNSKIKNHPELRDLQFWTLTVGEDNIAELRCNWDREHTVYTETMQYVNFPLSKIRLFVQPIFFQYSDRKIPREWVVYLPSEH